MTRSVLRPAASVTYKYSNLASFPPALGRELSVILFQSARELVYNLIKHAQARHGAIGLATDPAGLRLSVEDDGVGFATGFSGGFAVGFTGRVPGAKVTADPGQGGRFGL